MEGRGGQWSDPVNLDTEGTDVRVIEHRNSKSTLIIQIRRITSVQKQVCDKLYNGKVISN